MENTSYYLEGERLVFLTEEDARDYFFKEEIYHSVTLYYSLNEFLNDKGYNCEDVFLFDDVEKVEVRADYYEALFKRWVCKELVECDMYE
jgi:hypothetical protein